MVPLPVVRCQRLFRFATFKRVKASFSSTLIEQLEQELKDLPCVT